MKLEIGDRVEVFHETLKTVCYGLGTIEDIGHYFGGTLVYFVRVDAFPNRVGSYTRRQLKKVREGS